MLIITSTSLDGSMLYWMNIYGFLKEKNGLSCNWCEVSTDFTDD